MYGIVHKKHLYSFSLENALCTVPKLISRVEFCINIFSLVYLYFFPFVVFFKYKERTAGLWNFTLRVWGFLFSFVNAIWLPSHGMKEVKQFIPLSPISSGMLKIMMSNKASKNKTFGDLVTKVFHRGQEQKTKINFGNRHQSDTLCHSFIIYFTNKKHWADHVSWLPVSGSQSISHSNQHISREAWDDGGWLLNGGTWSGNERGRLTVTGKWKRKKVAKQCLSHCHCEGAAAPYALFSFPPLIFTPSCSLVFTWSHPFTVTLSIWYALKYTQTLHTPRLSIT